MDTLKIDIINLTQLSTDDYQKEAVKGKWGYRGENAYSVTVLKGIGYISVPISENDVTISVNLPNCYDFWCPVYKQNGVRTVKVTNSELNLTVAAGESVSATFKLK